MGGGRVVGLAVRGYSGGMHNDTLAIATEYADALAMREHIEAHGGYEEVTDAHLAGIADRFFAALG